MTDESEAQLQVEDLWVRFRTPQRVVEAVRGASFSVAREKVGIVGESGSGKTMTGRAILRLTPANAQDPKFSLDPVMRVGEQIGEAIPADRRGNRAETRKRVLDMLAAVHIRDPHRVFNLYPHELSGGMGQRVMIAMMLMPEPSLLIADEPTSALDVTVRMQVLAILDELVARRGLGLIFISHDLNLVASFCDRVLIMYAGRIVEQCKAAELARAHHPYTQGLLASLPRIGSRGRRLAVLSRDPAWRTE
jgi:peptide/nickel transport system ATP-binding protein